MPYEVFVRKINRLLKKSKEDASAVFCNEDGLFSAKFSDGTTIVSNGLSNRVLVKWGCGHQAFATI